MLEITELETNDIMSISGGEEGSITVNGTTITGPKNQFSVNFGDL